MLDLSTIRFCFIAGTLGQGGAERQLCYTLQTLRALGARPRVLCLTQGEFWEERLAELEIPVIWIGQNGSRAQRLLTIIATLRRELPDVIQSQHFYTNLYAAAAARALRRCEVGALRSDTFSDVQADPLLGRFSLRAPRRLAANSRAAINSAIALGVPAARLHLLPNVVDIEIFRPAPRTSSDTVTLLAVGRMTAEKRFDRFLDALAELRRHTTTRVKGLLVGDGPLRPQLEAQARALQLSPDVLEFRARVAEMPAIYAEADVLVLTSDYEGTPNVVLEAMAAGLPVVATRVGGLPEIMRNGEHGFLIEPELTYRRLSGLRQASRSHALNGNGAARSAPAADRTVYGTALTQPDELVETLLLLINNPILRIDLGRQARAHIEAHYSLQRLPHYLTDFYQAVLS